jgi:hypothetical protein
MKNYQVFTIATMDLSVEWPQQAMLALVVPTGKVWGPLSSDPLVPDWFNTLDALHQCKSFVEMGSWSITDRRMVPIYAGAVETDN